MTTVNKLTKSTIAGLVTLGVIGASSDALAGKPGFEDSWRIKTKRMSCVDL